MNRIVEVKLSLMGDGHWSVSVRKEFFVGTRRRGTTFVEHAGPGIHHALDLARGMVTLSPGVTPYERG